MNFKILALLSIILTSLAPVSAWGEDGGSFSKFTEPLWEIGVGGGAFYTPDYPASDKNSLHGLALPYLIYRGDFLRIGRDSILKGVFFDTDIVEFDISAAASFNSSSDDNDARRGMPDLDYLFEIGPQLKIKLGAAYGGRAELQLPFRAVFSTDITRIDHRGYLFNPKIAYRKQNLFRKNIDMDCSISSGFATKNLHEYFYRVAPQYATETRPAYEADSGYLGSRLTFGLSYDITEHLRAYVGGGIGYYGGAVNQRSPLFRQEITTSVHAALTWSRFQSKTRVPSSRQ